MSKRTTQQVTDQQALAKRLLDMGLKKADVAGMLEMIAATFNLFT